ncbi:MAG: DUF4012 domain-containing protein [Patescibacteria group bacterium]
MPKKNKRQCSVCRNYGHNKLTCALLRETANPKRIISRQNKKKAAVKKFPVIVRVLYNMESSPHVINLKNDEREKVLNNIEVFREELKKTPELAAVDFAALVRQERQRSESSDRRAAIDRQLLKNESQRAAKQPIARNARIAIGRRLSWRPRWPLPRLSISHRAPSIIFRIKDAGKAIKNYPFLAAQRHFLQFKAKRMGYAIIALLIIAILPFPAIGYYQKIREDGRRVVEDSTNAFLALQSSTVAAMQSNIPQAQYDLNVALNLFSDAGSIVDREYGALVYVMSMLPVIGNQVASRQHLLSAGHHLALGNTYLVQGIGAIQKEDQPVTARLAILRAHLKSALPQYREALEQLTIVDARTIPAEYQQSFVEFKFLYAMFIDDMEDMVDLAQGIELLLGSQDLKRYLLVFQNQNELRPTGGFMGSFATLDVQKGRIVGLDVPGGGTYDLQGQLDVFVKPPLPLQAVNARWEFQDANWFPDFAMSAQKMEWFYQHGRGATMDGVIAINASALERLLSVIGPIVDAERDLVLAQESAIQELQQEVEVNYDPEKNKPKEVIGDALGQILERLGKIQTADIIRLLTELNDALKQKEVQIFVNEPSLQSTFRGFGWTGEIISSALNQDYLMVVNTNIHGQKSDAKVEQEIEHQAVVQADGSVIDTVFIKKRHTGTAGELFYGVPNVSFIRVYVPEGAELLDAQGFVFPPEDVFKVPEPWYEDDYDLAILEQEEGVHFGSGTRITKEFGKTAFGNWMMVSPGGEVEAYFSYKLPFKIFDLGSESDKQTNREKFTAMISGKQNLASRYSLVVQKQSGTENNFISTVIYPDGWRPAWRSRDDIDLAANGASFKEKLETDEVIGVVMEKVKE